MNNASAENPNAFDDTSIAAIYHAIHSRRDIREFVPGALPLGLLDRLYAAAHAAPSVGYMQPWRLIHVSDPALREGMAQLVEEERLRTAAELPTRTAEFLKLKVEGIKTCAEILVVALMDASAACAIQNMWLAARAEGIGMGWVSFFEPAALARLFAMPPGAKPIAILCLGHVAQFADQPTLEALGWGQRLPLASVVFENHWPEDAQPTPTAY